MLKTIKILSLVLVVQVALLIWLRQAENRLAVFSSEEKILELAFDKVNQIVIEESKEDPEKGKEIVKLTLSRKDDSWILPENDDFPVSADKLKKISEDLLAIVKTWPVGKTGEAAKRLKVTDKEFNKKITFRNGEQILKTVFLGTSPGFRKVHLRVADDNNIYAATYNSYEVSLKASDWYDRDLLKIERKEVEGIQLADLTIEKQETGFELTGLAEDEQTVFSEMDKLVNKIIGLSYAEVLGTEDKEEYGVKEPIVEFVVQAKDRDPLIFAVGEYKEDDAHYVLKTSEFPYYFKINKSAIEAIKNVQREKLVEKKKKEEEKGINPPKPELDVVQED